MPAPPAKRHAPPLPTSSGPSSASPPKKRPRTSPSSTPRHPTTAAALTPLLQFWLSGANLSKDRYLTSQMLSADGWVPTSLFTRFNRAVALSATEADVIAALRGIKSPQLELAEGPDGATRVRLARGPPALEELVAAARDGADARTVYVEPLPAEARREQVEAVFKGFGEVVYVSLPRFPSGRCKGFAFVEFREEAGAEGAVCAASGDGGVGPPAVPRLKVIMRAEWRRRKERYKEERKAERVAAAKLRAEEAAAAAEALRVSEAASPTSLQQSTCDTAQPDSGKAGGDEPPDKAPMQYDRGLIVSITGLQGARRRVTRGALYEALRIHGELAYIDFSPRAPNECMARYTSADSARSAVAALSPTGGATVLGAVVVARQLQGDAECDYWARIAASRALRAGRKKAKGRVKAARRVAARVQPARKGG